MSGVYIKGMEMPKDCVVCPFGGNGCNKQHDFVYIGSRPDNCPLVPVPQHGRLIDADVLKKIVADSKHMDAEIYNGRTFYSDHLCVGADYDDVCAAIDETPTVIDAEEGE